MKLCQTCNSISADANNYCARDGRLLIEDPLATALQEAAGAKYAVTRLIGTGSMGAVYRAEHNALGDVAIKVMLGPPDDHKLSERFLREARALRKLNNPHAVRVYDLERSPIGLTYMVMEMVEGRSLRDELRERGRLRLEETIEIAEAVCDALVDAHECGIIHRDLKPDNILLAEESVSDGEVSRLIKIVDFGIAKLRGTQQGGEDASMQLTKYGTPIGTPFYMSPEQWFGDGPGFTALDGRTDIYALGCTLYEALAGQPPFLGQTKEEMRGKHLNEQPRPLSEMISDVPEMVNLVILRALEKDRDFRQATAAEFSAELRRAFDESRAPGKDELERSRAVTTPPANGEARSASAEVASQMQTTEESDAVVRNWAAGEAQALIEQVRERPLEASQMKELEAAQHEVPESAQEEHATPTFAAAAQEMEDPEVTLEPGSLRFENDRLVKAERNAPSHESEFRQTLILHTAATPGPAESPASHGLARQERSHEGQDIVLAQAGGWHLGLFAEEVEDISVWRSTIPLPHAPPAVLGIVSLRGRMLTVIDPAVLLGENGAGREKAVEHSFIIALRGDEQLALAVSHIGDTIGIFSAEIEPPPKSAAALNIMRGIIQGAHGRTILLDARELFDAAIEGAERRRQRSGERKA